MWGWTIELLQLVCLSSSLYTACSWLVFICPLTSPSFFSLHGSSCHGLGAGFNFLGWISFFLWVQWVGLAWPLMQPIKDFPLLSLSQFCTGMKSNFGMVVKVLELFRHPFYRGCQRGCTSLAAVPVLQTEALGKGERGLIPPFPLCVHPWVLGDTDNNKNLTEGLTLPHTIWNLNKRFCPEIPFKL